MPVGMSKEVQRWVKERQKIKRLLREIDEYAQMLVRQHVKTSRAARANKERANRKQGPSSPSS